MGSSDIPGEKLTCFPEQPERKPTVLGDSELKNMEKGDGKPSRASGPRGLTGNCGVSSGAELCGVGGMTMKMAA